MLQLHSSYSALGKDFKNTFDDLVKQLNHSRAEANDLRAQLSDAGKELVKANESASSKLSSVLSEEKARAATDRANLIAQMTSLVQSLGESQEQRLEGKLGSIQAEITSSNERYEHLHESYQTSMTEWSEKEKAIVDDILKSRESVKTKIKTDWLVNLTPRMTIWRLLTIKAANEHNHAIQTTTQSVHEETVQIVDEQMKHLDVQLQALDEILCKVQQQNSKHHEAHVESLTGLAVSVKQSYTSIGEHLDSASGRAQALEQDFSGKTESMSNSIKELNEQIHVPLSDLRTDIMAAPIIEYVPTGQTPQKVQYHFTSTLPRTEPHDVLLGTSRHSPAKSDSLESLGSHTASPSKTTVYTDEDALVLEPAPADHSPTAQRKTTRSESSQSSLRELDVNAAASVVKADAAAAPSSLQMKAHMLSQQPPSKRQNTGIPAHGK